MRPPRDSFDPHAPDPHAPWFRIMPAPSLLRLSAAARLGGALVVISALWAATFWALR